MSEVAPGVFRLGTHIVNWYLVKDGEAFTAVDAGLPAFADTLDADLRQHGVEPRRVEAVVLDALGQRPHGTRHPPSRDRRAGAHTRGGRGVAREAGAEVG